MHLLSARVLASRITCDGISRTKTRALLGESIGYNNLRLHDNDLTEVLDGSAASKKLLRRHMYEEAKSFYELERLAEHLDNVETISSHVTIIEE